MANKIYVCREGLEDLGFFIRYSYFICGIILRVTCVRGKSAPGHRVYTVHLVMCNNDAEEHNYHHCTRPIYYVSNCPADLDRFDGRGSRSSLG